MNNFFKELLILLHFFHLLCKSVEELVVKARMEQSGMKWSLSGAQSIMDVRAVYQNKDWGNFMEFVILQEQKKIYPESKHLILQRA